VSKLDQRFEEDRRLRDTARKVLMADVEHARSDFSAKGIADRIGGRIGDGTKDVYSVAKMHADDHRGIIAIVIGALLLWLGRGPIMEALGMVEEALDDALEFEGTPPEDGSKTVNPPTPEHIPTPGDEDEH